MNTRGLMELVILTIGRDLGVITDAVFAMMVIMALVTTALTTPILNLVYPERLFEPEQKAVAAGAGTRRRYTVLLPVSDPNSGEPLLQLASMLAGPADMRHLLALHLKRPVDRDAYRAGLDEVTETVDPVLAPLLAAAKTQKIDVEPIAFVTRDVPDDIASLGALTASRFSAHGLASPGFR